MGRIGCICLTSTQPQGLLVKTNDKDSDDGKHPQSSSSSFPEMTRLSSSIVHINPYSQHITITERYKLLHSRTHRYINSSLNTTAKTTPSPQQTSSSLRVIPIHTNLTVSTPIWPSSTAPTSSTSSSSSSSSTGQPLKRDASSTKRSSLFFSSPSSGSLPPPPPPTPLQLQQQQQLTFVDPDHKPITFCFLELHDATIVYTTRVGHFELYCTFTPLTPRESIYNSLNRTISFMLKERDNFVMTPLEV